MQLIYYNNVPLQKQSSLKTVFKIYWPNNYAIEILCFISIDFLKLGMNSSEIIEEPEKKKFMK